MISASSLLTTSIALRITGRFLSFVSILLKELSKVSSAELCPQEGQKKALPITAYRELHSLQTIF